MSKNHRGSGIRSLPAHGRGTCAICGKTNIKVLWEKEINGQTVNVCKYCNNNEIYFVKLYSLEHSLNKLSEEPKHPLVKYISLYPINAEKYFECPFFKLCGFFSLVKYS